MASGQRPFSELFPSLPEGFQEPFWYASLQSFWLYYRVEPDLIRDRLPDLPAVEGLEVALFDFGGGDRAGLASLDLQRYTGHGQQYLETTDEVEFNVYAYPQARVPQVPLMTWQQYLLGTDQTKTIGGYRLHVPCDNQIAVLAGRELYGEPKYLAVFDYTVPSLNGPATSAWTYQVYQDLGDPPDPSHPHTPVKGPLIYGLDCDLGGVPAVPASPSPLIEYGVLDQRVVANFWDFYGPFDTYMGEGLRADITLGTAPDPTHTLRDVKALIGDSQPIAAQVYTSPPVSAESRGWYQVPT
jgi:Acetoacetate decarboxylase (ADC)